jgi:hypothetical protein
VRGTVKYWWANQGKNWDLESSEGVVRASAICTRDTFRKTVGEVRKGDIIVHNQGSLVFAISRATRDGRWEDRLQKNYKKGWEAPTEYFFLDPPIHFDNFRRHIKVPKIKGYAFNKAAKPNQGYFFRFDRSGLAIVIRQFEGQKRIPKWLTDAIKKSDSHDLQKVIPVPTHEKNGNAKHFADITKRIPPPPIDRDLSPEEIQALLNSVRAFISSQKRRSARKSEAHKGLHDELKNFLFENPGQLRANRAIKKEYTFCSDDRCDLLLQIGDSETIVEVKVGLGPDGIQELVKGLFQLAKYEALLNAERLPNSPLSSLHLAAYEIPWQVEKLAKLFNVKCWAINRKNVEKWLAKQYLSPSGSKEGHR